MSDDYCICPDCIRCGCGMWEKHHDDISQITPATIPVSSEEN